jgi:hypothetical protein
MTDPVPGKHEKSGGMFHVKHPAAFFAMRWLEPG